ncbi:MAG: crotonase/enoyl-CoA hydratase family protein [Alphaproteobacteria bacterium]|nr:crotonase/enoyl-CoA hydratase family protein [Alphaproteobacteria bacterium]
MSDVVTYSAEDGVAMLAMDDGKANAFSLDMTTALSAALDQAEKDARVTVVMGRPGMFCAGFDLNVIRGDDAEAQARMRAGGFTLLKRLYLHPQPVVMACTGHALAGGALMLLVGDLRIGVAGAFKIGLNEVGIGLTLPSIGVELARDRLSPQVQSSAVIGAQIFDPEGARTAGYLDEIVSEDDFAGHVAAKARGMLELDATAFAETKRNLRQATVDRIAE